MTPPGGVAGEVGLDRVVRREHEWIAQTYRRLSVAIVRALGTKLYDIDGREFTDFLSGVGVANVGHSHPEVVAAVSRQVQTLVHVSDLVYTEPQIDLAERLSRGSLGGKVFFGNSGAEAVECAIKMARRHAESVHGRSARAPIVVAAGAFHGRTLGTMAATPKFRDDRRFHPLLEGFKVVPRDDVSALRKVAENPIAAIMVEPIQGEAGVHAVGSKFLATARQICDSTGALLIFDEVQTGVGRTGTMWAYEGVGVEPDLLVAAKALAGGLPIGAVVAQKRLGDLFERGDHGSTFGGNALVSAAAIAVLDIVEEPGFLEHAARLGEYFREALGGLVDRAKARSVRGRGLMLALDLNQENAAEVVLDALDAGFVLNATGPRTLRFLPPLTVERDEIEALVEYLERRLTA